MDQVIALIGVLVVIAAISIACDNVKKRLTIVDRRATATVPDATAFVARSDGWFKPGDLKLV